MMKAVILTSDRPRHRYFANIIAKSFDVVAVIAEDKGGYYAEINDSSALARFHFKMLQQYEQAYFDNHNFPACDLLNIHRSTINRSETLEWVSGKEADCVFLFGTGILGEGWLHRFPERIINLHLGYSPFYRGSATLFWPFVKNEKEKVGVTIHLAEKKVDAGRVLKVVTPIIQKEDNYYDIVNKAIRNGVDQVPQVAMKYFEGRINPEAQDLSLGKVFRRSDFDEISLRQALINGGVSIPESL